MEVKDRIAGLRELMKQEGIQAYLVPSTDPHHSEYLPEFWKRREFISGFTGSAGDVIITLDEGGLWTDGRYFIQAEEQLKGSGIDLYRMGMPDVPKLEDWVADKLSGGGILGVDPRLLSMESSIKLSKVLSEKGASIKYIETNLIDDIWDDRPSPSEAPLEVLSLEFTGESIEDKLGRIRKKMGSKDCTSHILCSLDTIAWTFNMRGKDIDFNPVFISYAVITKDKAHLFIDTRKVTEKVKKHLGDLVEVHPYRDIASFLEGTAKEEERVWIDPKTTNRWLMIPLEGKVKLHKERSPVTDLKSVKNDTELNGFRTCLVTDGVAMVRFLKWLDGAVPNGGVTELSASAKIEGFRKEGKDFVGLSFTTIAGYAEHGAIVHYDPTPESDVELKPQGIFLLDSGAQYLTGTTDITRTVTLGEPTDEQKEMFTRVLKGHIGIATLKFPKGFCGKQLELPARKPLWDVGRNYNHGTGHGVGHYLNVHEGPMGITPRDIGVPLLEGNVLSNEPGYYKEGEYGIRIENLIVVRKDEKLSSPDLEFLGFETITFCPIDRDLIKKEIMTEEEVLWLNEYHRQVFEELSPRLDAEHKEWLKEKTGEI